MSRRPRYLRSPEKIPPCQKLARGLRRVAFVQNGGYYVVSDPEGTVNDDAVRFLTFPMATLYAASRDAADRLGRDDPVFARLMSALDDAASFASRDLSRQV